MTCRKSCHCIAFISGMNVLKSKVTSCYMVESPSQTKLVHLLTKYLSGMFCNRHFSR